MMKVSIVAANLQVTAFASERLWVSWLRGLIRTSITASPPVLQFFMGFNRRKMQDQRREAVEKEASSRRATDAQVLEDSERLNRRLERAPGKADADAVLADDRCCHHGGLLAPMGALPSLLHDQCN
jgi:hypothetical protein